MIFGLKKKKKNRGRRMRLVLDTSPKKKKQSMRLEFVSFLQRKYCFWLTIDNLLKY